MISNNGFDCQEMYERDCQPEFQACRMGVSVYECKVCGKIFGEDAAQSRPEDASDEY